MEKLVVKLPKEQMLSMLGFTDDMLTSLESDIDSLQPLEQRLVGQLRNAVSKAVQQVKEQIDDEPSTS